MSFSGLIDALVHDTLHDSLPFFRPELILCASIVVLLLARIIPVLEKIPAFYFALVGTATALWFALPGTGLPADAAANEAHEIFTGMLIFDSVTIFMRSLLLGFGVLFVVLTGLSGLSDREDGPDFYCLVLGATLGMCLMASANHMMMVFLAVEMASVPSYVLAGIVKGRPRASEAALKYSIFGAGASGVMLYGISLLCGVLNSAHLPTMARQLAALDLSHIIASGEGTGTVMILALGGLMVMVGLAFKLSAVPFHFWCPDVFEGATAEVNAFLSVASKAAALALLVRVAVGLGFTSPDANVAAIPKPAAAEVAVAESPTAAQLVALRQEDSPPATANLTAAPTTVQTSDQTAANSTVAYQTAAFQTAALPATPSDALGPVRKFIVMLLAFISAITCTFGNLAAYGQSNIKRMLAYSTIAHAGYMMMPVAAAIAAPDPRLAQQAISALLFYISLYLFMNLGAFAIVAFLRNTLHTEQIDDLGGLIRTMPITTLCFSLILISLIGLPPLAGFAAKLLAFYALVSAGGPILITLLVIGGLNTAISLVYYLRVVKVMTMDPEPDTRAPATMPFVPATYIVLVTIPVVVLGFAFNAVLTWAQWAASHLYFG